MKPTSAYEKLSTLSPILFEDSAAGLMTPDDYFDWWNQLTRDRPDQTEVLRALGECLGAQSARDFQPHFRTTIDVYNFSLLHYYFEQADPELVLYYHRIHDQFTYPSKGTTVERYSAIRDFGGDPAHINKVLVSSGIIAYAIGREEARTQADLLPLTISSLTRYGAPFDWAIRVSATAGRIRTTAEMRDFHLAGWTPQDVNDLANQFFDIITAHEYNELLFNGIARASRVADHGPDRAFALAASDVPRSRLQQVAAENADIPDEYFRLLHPQVEADRWEW